MSRLLSLLIRIVVANLSLLVLVCWLASQVLTLDLTIDMPRGQRVFLFIDKSGWVLDGHQRMASNWDVSGEIDFRHQYQSLLQSRDEFDYWHFAFGGIRSGIEDDSVAFAQWSVGACHWFLLLITAGGIVWLWRSRLANKSSMISAEE